MYNLFAYKNLFYIIHKRQILRYVKKKNIYIRITFQYIEKNNNNKNLILYNIIIVYHFDINIFNVDLCMYNLKNLKKIYHYQFICLLFIVNVF